MASLLVTMTRVRRIQGALFPWLSFTPLLVSCVLVWNPAWAKVRFAAGSITHTYKDLLWADLNGDRLKDLVLLEAPQAAVYFQNRTGSFGREPDVFIDLGAPPTVLWSARFGRPAESLLALTHDGVSEWLYTKSGSFRKEQIISQHTMLPEATEESTVFSVRLSAWTLQAYPLILVPVSPDLQVWGFSLQERTWQLRQTIPQVMAQGFRSHADQASYTRTFLLSASCSDLNGDGADDLIVCVRKRGRVTYRVFPQTSTGSFTLEATLTYRDKADWLVRHHWDDLNGDGHVDLVKGTWLREPWFIPGTRSGKVLVEISLAPSQGPLPGKPNQVFRKYDWRAEVPLVDIDGDGITDLVLGYSAFDGREGVRKTLTAQQLDHTLRFYWGSRESGFAEEPDLSRKIILHLSHHGLHMTWSQRRYLESLFDVTGDFDGDGDRDLLVRDGGDRISVYPFLSRQKGFHKRAGVTLGHSGPLERFRIDDLNGDGISDLVVEVSNGLKTFISKGGR